MTTLTNYQQFIHLRTYARYLPKLNRRETWSETVSRFAEAMIEELHHKAVVDFDDYSEEFSAFMDALKAVEDMKVMPSMRCLHSAGEALVKENLTAYNCGYLPMDSLKSFSELLYVLMCGTGCGFSVQQHHIDKLPVISHVYTEEHKLIIVGDSREGWAIALNEYLEAIFQGYEKVTVDVAQVRPEGTPLKTFGGRASGPGPLINLFEFINKICKGAIGRRLTSIEVYDISCMVAQCVISGGVRRSACICLFSDTDESMYSAKSNKNLEGKPWRYITNNSVVKRGEITPEFLDWFFGSIFDRTTGEPGLLVEKALVNRAEKAGRETKGYSFGVNPCGEIILRERQLCNLTEVVVRSDDTVESLMEKVEWATILGTLQSTLTKFNHSILHEDWKKNSEDERLLGVSLTGLMDNPEVASSAYLLDMLREVAIGVNEKWSKILGIKQSRSITTVKPSGTVSQLVNSSSGLHSRYARYYKRNVQVSRTDPLAHFMLAQEVPHFYPFGPTGDPVFSFYIKSPEGATVNPSVEQQLSTWETLAESWCDHNPSCTIFVKESEWEYIKDYIFEMQDSIGGLAFFPKVEETAFSYLPFESISEEEYLQKSQLSPVVKWEDFRETVDSTEGAKQYACTGDKCSLI